MIQKKYRSFKLLIPAAQEAAKLPDVRVWGLKKIVARHMYRAQLLDKISLEPFSNLNFWHLAALQLFGLQGCTSFERCIFFLKYSSLKNVLQYFNCDLCEHKLCTSILLHKMAFQRLDKVKHCYYIPSATPSTLALTLHITPSLKIKTSHFLLSDCCYKTIIRWSKMSCCFRMVSMATTSHVVTWRTYQSLGYGNHWRFRWRNKQLWRWNCPGFSRLPFDQSGLFVFISRSCSLDSL